MSQKNLLSAKTLVSQPGHTTDTAGEGRATLNHTLKVEMTQKTQHSHDLC